jgi:phosphatidate cytidylyltransferase
VSDGGSTPATGSKWADLALRAISAVVLIPAVLLDVWVGGIWFDLMVALVAVLVAQEWVRLVHRDDPLQFALHAAAAIAGAVLPSRIPATAVLIVIIVAWLLSALAVKLRDPAPANWSWLGIPYVGLPALSLVLLHIDPVYGAKAVVWVMISVWAADTLAYFAGRTIGGPKLAPVLSPKKTWAGLGGAIAGSAAASAIFALAAGLPVGWLAAIAAPLAIVEQGGDLFKSALKRFYGVKDSGTLIPGHGGVIDRVDGLLAVACAAALIGFLRSGGSATAAGVLGW